MPRALCSVILAVPGCRRTAVDANDQKVQNLEYGYTFSDSRRSVYTPAFRNVRHPLFEVFDFADINQPIGQRTTSTVATQAFFLMNSPKVIEQARAAAALVLKSESDTPNASNWPSSVLCSVHRRTRNSRKSASTSTPAPSGNATADETRDVWARFIQTLWSTPEFRFCEVITSPAAANAAP
jgi:hypothetical protein